MTKRQFWAVRSGELMTIQGNGVRYRTLRHDGETLEGVVARLGFRTIGGFTITTGDPYRSTAKVVAL